MAHYSASSVRVMWVDRLLAIIPVLIVAGLFLRLSTPNRHPELLPKLAGCYAAAPPHQNLKFRLDASGIITTNDDSTHFDVTKDKIGMTIEPERAITYDSNVSGGRIDFGNGNPLILRLNADQTRFTIPSRMGSDLEVRRTRC